MRTSMLGPRHLVRQTDCFFDFGFGAVCHSSDNFSRGCPPLVCFCVNCTAAARADKVAVMICIFLPSARGVDGARTLCVCVSAHRRPPPTKVLCPLVRTVYCLLLSVRTHADRMCTNAHLSATNPVDYFAPFVMPIQIPTNVAAQACNTVGSICWACDSHEGGSTALPG